MLKKVASMLMWSKKSQRRGKDLGILKEKIRFGIEPRDKQLANGAQGITGRAAGDKRRDLLDDFQAKVEFPWVRVIRAF